MARISIVVPIFNGLPYLPAFFESLERALPPGSELILVDDASTQPVLDTVPDFPRAESVLKLRNDRNVGYSAAVNRGFDAATGDVIVQLNTDLLLDGDAITAMVDLIDREHGVGIVGSRLIFPTTGLLQHIGMAFGYHSKPHIYHELPATHPLANKSREVQITTGATVAMTRRTLDIIGRLDERYFNHNEDIDHCLRAVRAGLRNFVCADSVAYHWVSQSGPARFAQVATSEAAFWATWGGRYIVDLDRYVDEALDHILNIAPDLASVPFVVIDLTRGEDVRIIFDRLCRRWPGIEARVRDHRQSNSFALQLWLPMLLPHWTATEHTPFIYIVDRYRDLEENHAWFRNRRTVVQEELIVDLQACVVRTSELPNRDE